ncbi:MAG: LysR substrate-binding domain-containing protein, partial [Acidobacteriota bacterium]
VPRRIHAVPLTEAIIELVKADAGVACLARWAVAPHLASGELVAHSLGREGFRRTWIGAYRRHGATLPLIERFTEHLSHHMRQLSAAG